MSDRWSGEILVAFFNKNNKRKMLLATLSILKLALAFALAAAQASAQALTAALVTGLSDTLTLVFAVSICKCDLCIASSEFCW